MRLRSDYNQVPFPPGFDTLEKEDTGPLPDCPLCEALPYDGFKYHYIEFTACSNPDCPLSTPSFDYDEWRRLNRKSHVASLQLPACEATAAPEVIEDE